MKQYLYKREINKGYIPSDKITVASHGQFESFSFSHIEGLKEKMEVLQNAYKSDIYMQKHKIDVYEYGFAHITSDFLAINGYAETDSYQGKVFYFNMNHDCIQVFISRGFESKK